MGWSSFVSGIVSTLFAYALFTGDNEDEVLELETETDDEEELDVHDFKSRHVILSCQTCRKQKRHKEIEHNLFQCVKCKRHVDLRAS